MLALRFSVAPMMDWADSREKRKYNQMLNRGRQEPCCTKCCTGAADEFHKRMISGVSIRLAAFAHCSYFANLCDCSHNTAVGADLGRPFADRQGISPNLVVSPL